MSKGRYVSILETVKIVLYSKKLYNLAKKISNLLKESEGKIQI